MLNLVVESRMNMNPNPSVPINVSIDHPIRSRLTGHVGDDLQRD